jgi:hypothetical protein
MTTVRGSLRQWRRMRATVLLAAATLIGAAPVLATELKMASGYPDGNYLTQTV